MSPTGFLIRLVSESPLGLIKINKIKKENNKYAVFYLFHTKRKRAYESTLP